LIPCTNATPAITTTLPRRPGPARRLRRRPADWGRPRPRGRHSRHRPTAPR